MGPLSPFPHLQQKLWAPERPSQHPKCSPCPGDTAPAPGDTVWTGDPSPKPLSPQPPPRSAAPPAPCRPPGGHFCVPPGVPKTLLVPFGHRCCSSGRGGGQAGAPRRFHQREPKCHQIRPATCAHHRGVGAQGHGWPHGDWHPAVTPSWGFATRKKSPASCPKPCPAPWPGRKPMCFPHFVPGASPNFLTVFLGVLPTQTISEEGAAPL